MTDLTVRTLNALAKNISQDTVAALRGKLRGVVALPGEDGYDAARTIWNAMIDRRPGLVVRCLGAADVVHAVTLRARRKTARCRARRRPQHRRQRGVRRRSAHRSVADEIGATSIPRPQRARVEPGATLADFDKEAQAFGLATPTRHQLDDRRRRPHARRRLRLDHPQVRPDRRQSDLGGRRHGRRRAGSRQREGAPGSVLGAARRRRQFRRRDLVRVQAASARSRGAVRPRRASARPRPASCCRSSGASPRRRPTSSRSGW